jgi:hypothetical protein
MDQNVLDRWSFAKGFKRLQAVKHLLGLFRARRPPRIDKIIQAGEIGMVLRMTRRIVLIIGGWRR